MPADSHTSKLNLKETPSERARREEKAFRKAARRARKEQKYGASSSTHASSPSSSSRRAARATSPLTTPSPPRPIPLKHITDSPPSSNTHNQHSYYTHQSTHDAAFEQHLRDLHAQDTGAAASFESWETGQDYGSGYGWGDEPYVGQRIPRRWAEREGNVWRDPHGGVDEGVGGSASGKGMRGGLEDDEEAYVESIRQGMHRRKNLPEILRQERLAAEALATAERLASQKASNLAAESARLAKLAQAKSAKVEEAFEEERKAYEKRWKRFVGEAAATSTTKEEREGGDGKGKGKERGMLRFSDVPWPVFAIPGRPSGQSVRLADIRSSSIRAFLLPSPTTFLSTAEEEEAEKKRRKDILREAIRRYHPDKFGRYLGRVREEKGERKMVEEGVGIVGRCLVELMAER